MRRKGTPQLEIFHCSHFQHRFQLYVRRIGKFASATLHALDFAEWRGVPALAARGLQRLPGVCSQASPTGSVCNGCEDRRPIIAGRACLADEADDYRAVPAVIFSEPMTSTHSSRSSILSAQGAGVISESQDFGPMVVAGRGAWRKRQMGRKIWRTGGHACSGGSSPGQWMAPCRKTKQSTGRRTAAG